MEHHPFLSLILPLTVARPPHLQTVFLNPEKAAEYRTIARQLEDDAATTGVRHIAVTPFQPFETLRNYLRGVPKAAGRRARRRMQPGTSRAAAGGGGRSSTGAISARAAVGRSTSSASLSRAPGAREPPPSRRRLRRAGGITSGSSSTAGLGVLAASNTSLRGGGGQMTRQSTTEQLYSGPDINGSSFDLSSVFNASAADASMMSAGPGAAPGDVGTSVRRLTVSAAAGAVDETTDSGIAEEAVAAVEAAGEELAAPAPETEDAEEDEAEEMDSEEGEEESSGEGDLSAAESSDADIGAKEGRYSVDCRPPLPPHPHTHLACCPDLASVLSGEKDSGK